MLRRPDPIRAVNLSLGDPWRSDRRGSQGSRALDDSESDVPFAVHLRDRDGEVSTPDGGLTKEHDALPLHDVHRAADAGAKMTLLQDGGLDRPLHALGVEDHRVRTSIPQSGHERNQRQHTGSEEKRDDQRQDARFGPGNPHGCIITTQPRTAYPSPGASPHRGLWIPSRL